MENLIGVLSGMDVRFSKINNNLTVYIYGELDHCTSSGAKEILDKLINENINSKTVTFDLSGLTFMDSTGIGLLIGRYKKLRQFDVPVFLSGANVGTEKVIEIAGLYKIMPKI